MLIFACYHVHMYKIILNDKKHILCLFTMQDSSCIMLY